MPQTREELLKEYERLLDIQCSDGNWDADSYMHGMANGMILFHSMAIDPHADPDFKTAPEYWKSRSARYLKNTKKFFRGVWFYSVRAMLNLITSITGLTFDFKNRMIVKYREEY